MTACIEVLKHLEEGEMLQCIQCLQYILRQLSLEKLLYYIFDEKTLLIVRPDFHLLMSKSKLAFLLENILFALFCSEYHL